MSLDIATTNYAISNDIGYEGNTLMSGVASNLYSLIIVKFIGSMVIIMLMSKIIQKNEKFSEIGMRIIIFMMLFVVGNNLLVLNASALSFSNFSYGGQTGSINNGNGYFDDDASTFNYTGSRNVYIVAESTAVWIFEPISYASGTSGAYQVVNSTLANITDAVIFGGYVYFIDTNVLKKKKTRSDGLLCQSTDTGVSGCAQIMVSGIGETIRVINGVLYYTKGANLYHLDSTGSEVSDFAITAITIPGGGSQFTSYTLAYNGSTLQMYVAGASGGQVYDYYCTSSECTRINSVSLGASAAVWSTWFTTGTQVYTVQAKVGGGSRETKYYLGNSSTFSVNYVSVDNLAMRDRLYVGEKSVIGLIAQTNISYETFNSNEAGISNEITLPSDITYDTATIQSLDSTYYNKSIIYLNYNVVLDSLNVNNLLLDFDDYRWMIAMTDPNGVTQDIVQSPACMYDSILDTTCQITSSMGIQAPSNGWLSGSWSAKLYEINTITLDRALIATSSSFTVLNTSEENQSIIPPPFIPPTSGTAPQAISIIDGWVSWLGLGVNSVSKLLFAMIIIAIAGTVGLIWGNGNIAMVFAFVPYAFFTFIDYIPKWIFIITIILMAIVSKAFR